LSGLFSLWAVIFTGIQFWQNIIMVNAVFIILTLFFNLHHLIIYHTFQPYNRNMEVKSPLTAVINLVIYVITFTMWRTTNLPTVVYLIVLVVMIIYVIGGIQLMKRLAPKNFKMKT
jgi:phosphatidylserine synthase